MNEPIKVGDLVMVVKAGCEHEAAAIGLIFQVPALRYDCSHCPTCFHEYEAQWHAVKPGRPQSGYPLSTLKRIPPLEELDDVKQDEEITA